MKKKSKSRLVEFGKTTDDPDLSEFDLYINHKKDGQVEHDYVLWGNIRVRETDRCYQIYSDDPKRFVVMVKRHLKRYSERFCFGIREAARLYLLLKEIEDGKYEG